MELVADRRKTLQLIQFIPLILFYAPFSQIQMECERNIFILFAVAAVHNILSLLACQSLKFFNIVSGHGARPCHVILCGIISSVRSVKVCVWVVYMCLITARKANLCVR